MVEHAGSITSQISPYSPWFTGAPVSKTIVYLTAILFFVLESLEWRDEIALDGGKMLNDGQWYRLFLYHLTFGSVGELILGIMVLAPLMRRFEREMGSRRFASFLFFKTLTLATVFQAALIIMLDLAEETNCGPYPQIGSLLMLFHMYTPRLHPKFFSILGFDFSEKAIIYACTIQLMYSGGIGGTMLPSLLGMLTGYICAHKSVLELEYMPNSVFNFASNYLSVFDDNSGNQLYLTRTVARGMARGGIRGNGRDTAAAPEQYQPPPTAARFAQPQPPPPPSEETIEQLTMMGFDRESVITALRATDNNVEAAANRLLTM